MATWPPGVEEHAVFRALFAASPDGLMLVDGSGRICLANPTVSQLLGYANEELVGAPVEMLVPDAIRPRHAAYRQAYGSAPRARPMGGTATELVARRRDGSEEPRSPVCCSSVLVPYRHPQPATARGLPVRSRPAPASPPRPGRSR